MSDNKMTDKMVYGVIFTSFQIPPEFLGELNIHPCITDSVLLLLKRLMLIPSLILRPS